MKLRNKKTGEVIETYKIVENAFGDIVMLTLSEDERYPYEYKSLAELSAEWEDFTPPEPLIKDEKIRKAVRAVADITGVSILYYDYDEGNEMVRLSDMNGQILAFKSKKLSVKAHDSYTIAELCGEKDNE